MEDEPTAAQQQKPEANPPAPSLFGAPTKLNTPAPSSLFGTPNQPQQPFGATQTNKSPFSILGNSDKQASTPLSPPSDKTPIASPPLKKEELVDDQKTPDASGEPPLPPDPTSKASYGPGDTSASSNVSKSSIDDAPLPPDFTTQLKRKMTEESRRYLLTLLWNLRKRPLRKPNPKRHLFLLILLQRSRRPLLQRFRALSLMTQKQKQMDPRRN